MEQASIFRPDGIGPLGLDVCVVHVTALQALNVLHNNTWMAFNAGLGAMMLGAAGCLLPLASRSRYLGSAALLLGVALFIPYADFLALLFTGIWIVVASVVQLRTRAEHGFTPAASAT